MSPLVSVVIRSYNRGERLLRAIRSAIAQTQSGAEIVVVDDGSTDGSVQRVRDCFGERPDLRLIECAQNAGAGAAANVGVAAATAPLIAFLDSDDEWREDFLAQSLAALDRHPTASLSYCDYTEVWESFDLERTLLAESRPDQRTAMLVGGFIHTMSLVVMHREAIRRLGGFEESYRVSHDFFLWLKLALDVPQPCVHVPLPMVRHHRSADGVTVDYEGWWAEYEEALSWGYEQPSAAPHADLKPRGLHNISVGIVTRRKAGEWLERTSGAFVSVAIRTRGNVAALAASLASALRQDYQNLELLVIDAEPGDATSRYLETLNDPRVAHVPLGGQLTGGQMLNFALAAASGELIAFMDAGDRWDPSYLTTQVRANSFIVGDPLYSVAAARTALGAVLEPCAPRSADLILETLTAPRLIPLACHLFKRADLLALGGANDLLDHFEAFDITLKLLTLRDAEGAPAYRHRPPVRCRRVLVVPGETATRQDAEGDPRTTLNTIIQIFLGSADGAPYRHLAPALFAASSARLQGI